MRLRLACFSIHRRNFPTNLRATSSNFCGPSQCAYEFIYSRSHKKKKKRGKETGGEEKKGQESAEGKVSRGECRGESVGRGERKDMIMRIHAVDGVAEKDDKLGIREVLMYQRWRAFKIQIAI